MDTLEIVLKEHIDVVDKIFIGNILTNSLYKLYILYQLRQTSHIRG